MSDASIRPSELLWMELYASAEEKVAAGNHKARSRMDTLASLKRANLSNRRRETTTLEAGWTRWRA